MHYAEWKEADSKYYTLYDFTDSDILEKANDQVQKITDQRLTGVESRQRSLIFLRW